MRKTKKLTALTRIGIESVTPATACATGVAIAKIKSSLSLTSFSAIVWHADCSPAAFCWSISYLMHKRKICYIR